VPKIFVTGEFFANHANGDGNYHVRKFIMNEGCQVSPSLMCERIRYDFHRRLIEYNRQLEVVGTDAEKRKRIIKSIKKNKSSQKVTVMSSNKCLEWIGAEARTTDVAELAARSNHMYSERAFGGEGNLEVAEAMEAVEHGYDGFVTLKPFGCMPSSGVSDGVQAKIQDLFPQLNYLSVETSGDNAANILNRVSMMIFRARQNFERRVEEEKSSSAPAATAGSAPAEAAAAPA
jgi:predicted nucleotide-binding protein (sugar kinase/HSP70/actin superfamily)